MNPGVTDTGAGYMIDWRFVKLAVDLFAILCVCVLIGVGYAVNKIMTRVEERLASVEERLERDEASW